MSRWKLGDGTIFLSMKKFCKLWNSGHIADEFHYILECKDVINLRKKYLHTKYMYCILPNIMKFSELMLNNNCLLLKKNFVYIDSIITDKRQQNVNLYL
jgi:hypothetical protein